MHERILLVDGDCAVLELAKRVLGNEHYDVRVASSANEALRVADSFRPQLILSDMRLPGSADALEMVRRLRTASTARTAAIVMVTTGASEAEWKAALIAGCDDFISQPLSTPMLRDLAASWIGKGPGGARLSPTGSTWMRRFFQPARRPQPLRGAPTYSAGTRLPPADHFAPRRAASSLGGRDDP